MEARKPTLHEMKIGGDPELREAFSKLQDLCRKENIMLVHGGSHIQILKRDNPEKLVGTVFLV